VELGPLVERLYGLPWALPESEPTLYDLALRQYQRYARCADALRAALGQSSEGWARGHAFGLLTDALLIGLPSPPEAVWLELEAPHAVWVYAGEWRELDRLGGPAPSRFLSRARRARWLLRLLPGHAQLRGTSGSDDALDAHALWRAELGELGPAELEQLWDLRSKESCADALFGLWAAYFLGADPLLGQALYETEGHPAAAVQAARAAVHAARWDSASDWLLRHVRAQRAAFLERVRGSLPATAPEPGPVVLAERLPGGVPDRVDPCLAVFSSGLGQLGLELSEASGLTASEAQALLEAPGEPIVELATDGRGEGTDAIARLMSRPAFSQVRRLELGEAPLGSVSAALARSEHAAGLAEIEADRADLQDLQRLAARCAGVRSLRLTQPSPLGPEGFQLLARSPAFAELAELRCPSPHCRDEGMLAWAHSGRTRHLRELMVDNTTPAAREAGMRPRSALALLSCPMPELRSLCLGGHELGEAALLALAHNPRVGMLRVLRLGATGLTGESVEALARCAWLSQCFWLELDRDPVGPRGVRALAHSGHLRGVRDLRLGGVQDEGAELLARARFERLAQLHLAGCGLTSAGLGALAGAPWLASLGALWLEGNAVGEEGALALARSPNARGLGSLSLDGNPIGEAGVRALLSLPGLARLRARGCGVPDSAHEALQGLRPEVELTVG
jgi:hypothetical protein